MDFKEFISKVHPDPDSLLNDKFEQMCLLAEQYKDTINLQLQQTGVSGSANIPKPYHWIKEEKFKIQQGATYYEPKVTLTQCATWMMEYIKKYYR